jgi:phenylalanyl-tRNA synthetase beta chain
VQQRLKLAGMRPINNIVDATNYAMLEIGEPLHAFDYDVLVERAKGQPVTILTRTARSGEKLTTLDGVERSLDESTVLVCDSAGALSIAGVMGGAETEVSEKTTAILLEGAAWNFINIRKTARTQNLPSEASYRFSRGVHPAMAGRGVRRGLELMQAWAGGTITPGLVDEYPLPQRDPTVTITSQDVKRWLGITLSSEEIIRLLTALGFRCSRNIMNIGLGLVNLPELIDVTAPDHRLDIGEGVAGKADVIEEIARIYGYEKIPETRIADELPPQLGNPGLDKEERIRDLLVNQGLQEIISYRWTTSERENRRLSPDSPPDDKPYLRIANPLAYEKSFLRHSVLASLLEAAEHNARMHARLALFEIGPIFLPSEAADLPDELQRLSILLAGRRLLPGWQPSDSTQLDFFDLKGILCGLTDGLRLPEVRYEAWEHPSFHPGKCARILSGGKQVGVFGELHPQVRERYDWPVTYKANQILAADLDMDVLLNCMPDHYETAPVPEYPPVLEDLALVVDDGLPAERVAELIHQTGGKVLREVRLFDVYRGEKVGTGKKSLAYSLTYQAVDRTLSDKDVAGIRVRLLRRLEQELGAKIRQ